MNCLVCNTTLDGDEHSIETHVNRCLDAAQHGRDQPKSDQSTRARDPALDRTAELRQFETDRALAQALTESEADDVSGAWAHRTLNEHGQSDDETSSGRTHCGTGTLSSNRQRCITCDNLWKDMDIASNDADAKRDHQELCSRQQNDDSVFVGSVDGTGRFDWDKAGRRDTLKSTRGLISVLSTLLSRSHDQGRTSVAYLASEHTQHVSSKLSDAGWGCGYRNIQMFWSAVRHLPEYSSLHGSPNLPPPIPSILDLQRVIEQAWKAGFDPPGAAHFKSKLVKSRKWIGTTEAYVALTWLGVRVRIVDFPNVSGSIGTNVALVNWIQRYFSNDQDVDAAKQANGHDKPRNALTTLMASKGSPVKLTSKQPLYLQHQGHSRTVVGVDVASNGGDAWLLLFDPGKTVSSTMSRAASRAYESAPSMSSGCSAYAPSSHESKSLASSTEAAFWAQQPGLRHANLSTFGESSQKSREDDCSDLVSSYRKSLEPFRVSLKSLSRKDEYQILCLEPGPALTSRERVDRMQVKSTRVTR